MPIPGYLPYYVLAGTAAIIAALLLGLRRALRSTEWSAHDQRRVIRIDHGGSPIFRQYSLETADDRDRRSYHCVSLATAENRA